MADYVEASQAPSLMALSESRPLFTRGVSTFSSRRSKHQKLTLVALCLQLMITCIGLFLEMAPQTRIFQDIVCKDYYNNASSAVPLTEADCKIEPIQSQVAFINGWKDTFDQVPSIILAIPYGLLADRIGRKPVLFMSLIGYILEAVCVRLICWFPQTFPLRLIWLTPIFQCFGGGIQILISMLFTMLADVSTPDQRTTAFSCLISAFLLTQIVGIPISATIMTKFGPWTPYIIGLILQIAGVVYSFFVPETIHFVQKSDQVQATLSEEISGSPSQKKRFLVVKSKAVELGRFIKREKSICVFFIAIFVGNIAAQSQMNQLVLYVSKRFPWSIGQASILLSIKAAVYLLVLLVILPALRKLFHDKYKYSTSVVDMNLARASCFLLAASTLTIGIAPHVALVILGVVLFALGSAFDLIARSSATLLVPPSHVAVLYTALAVVQGLGIFAGGPSLALLWRWGMLLGPKWQGMPYLVLGALLAVVLFFYVLIPAPGSGDDAEEASQDLSERDALLP